MGLWEQHKKPSKKELKECFGDYYGCEICPWNTDCVKAKFPQFFKERKKNGYQKRN